MNVGRVPRDLSFREKGIQGGTTLAMETVLDGSMYAQLVVKPMVEPPEFIRMTRVGIQDIIEAQILYVDLVGSNTDDGS